MLNPSYWSSALFLKLLKQYTYTKLVRSSRVVQHPHFFSFILNSYKTYLSAPTPALRLPVEFSRPALEFIRAALVCPHLSDIQSNIKDDQNETSNSICFLFSPPQYAHQAFWADMKIKMSFFYIKTLSLVSSLCITTLAVLHLQNWFLGRAALTLENIFPLLEIQAVLLESLKGFFVQELPKRVNLFPILKRKKKLLKNKKFLTRPTPKTLRFFINLIKISSRAGHRLRNFRHFMNFLGRLRSIGGYRRLSAVMKLLKPFFYFRRRYRGRKSFYVPLIIMPQDQHKFTSRGLLNAALRRRSEKRFAYRLVMEVVDALRGRGKAYTYKRSILNLTALHKFNIARYRKYKKFLRKRSFY